VAKLILKPHYSNAGRIAVACKAQLYAANPTRPHTTGWIITISHWFSCKKITFFPLSI